jgi:polyisoprenoid-binding protein YceI
MSITATTPVTGTWTIDPIHSSVGFTVKHVVAKFRAGFAEVSGSYDADAGVLRGSAPAASLDIAMEDLKAHLLSPDFFDAANHPTIDFVSTDVRRDGDLLEVAGELTIRGVTKPVTARGEITEAVAGPAGSVLGIELEATIDRGDWGLDWNMDLPGGRKAVGDHVTMSVSLELGRPADEEV